MINSLNVNSRKTLSACIAISLAVHVLFLVFLQKQSLWFFSHIESQLDTDTWPNLLEKVPRNQILREVFLPNPSTCTSKHQLNPEFPSLELSHYSLSLQAPFLMPISISTEPIDTLLSRATDLPPNLSLSVPPIKNFDFLKDIPKNLIVPSIPTPLLSLPFNPRMEQISATRLTSAATARSSPPTEATLPSAFAPSSVIPIQEEYLFEKNIIHLPLPRLPQLPSLTDLATVNLSNFFDAELTFLPKPEGTGYLFALTMIPKEDLNLSKLRQNVTFLIDRSNSMQKERLLASKQAVLRALEEFDREDTFNIIVFDHKAEKLFSVPMNPSPDAIVKAEKFLDKTHLGSLFSTSDLYNPLLLTIPGKILEDEIHCAILLTDGEVLSKKQGQQALLNNWTLQNQGKVSLYAIGMGDDPNLEFLETICALNKGSLFQSTTQRGLKRQLLKLTKSIQTPLAKNLSLKIISRSSNHKIQIYPSSSKAPHLYLNQPYVILGAAETLDDFTLFIQGQLKEKWLNVKKPISFINAKKGGNSLKTAHQRLKKYAIDETFGLTAKASP